MRLRRAPSAAGAPGSPGARGHPRAAPAEQLVMRGELFLPRGRLDPRQLGEPRCAELLQPAPTEVLVGGHDAKRRLRPARASVAALDDPGEPAHVLSESRPEGFSAGVSLEPVDAEDPR